MPATTSSKTSFSTYRREPALQHWPWLKKIPLAAPGIDDLEVGVLEHDVRALAAELERDLLQVARRRLHDQLADLGRAGEGDLVDRVVRRERRAGVAEAGHDVDHPCGQPGLLHELAEAQRRQRRLLGGLQHHGQPAASAGPSFHAAISSGKFHGMIWPTTPTGSLRV